MSFGGFGGIPRKSGAHRKPVLGVVKSPAPSSKKRPPKLGPIFRTGPSRTRARAAPPPPLGPLPFGVGSAQPFHVVILSKLSFNLKACLAALFRCEPGLPHDRVIVVDDGAASGCERYFPRVRYVKGEKPFIFARNANIGIRAAGTDIILLNDDALLMTPGGFSNLSSLMSGSPLIGLSSASFFNGAYVPGGIQGIHREPKVIPFVSVYIPKRTIDQVGLLDERFTGYGFEDNDYCARVAALNLGLVYYDGCLVDHGKKERSTFRIRPDFQALFEENHRKFEQKWAATPRPAPPAPTQLKISCILTSYNRPRYVRQALKSLQDQTHKNFELLVFDDSSQMDIRPILKEFRLPISELVVSKVTPLERRTVNRLSVNVNRGLALCSGDLICFLADDDYYFPRWFEAAARFFQKNSGVQVGYGKLVYSKSGVMDFGVNGKVRWPGTVVDNPFGELDHNQVIHRRFEKPFPWPEDFSAIRSPDGLYFKDVSAHHPFYPIDDYAAVKRIHPKNLQRTVPDLTNEQAENLRE